MTAIMKTTRITTVLSAGLLCFGCGRNDTSTPPETPPAAPPEQVAPAAAVSNAPAEATNTPAAGAPEETAEKNVDPGTNSEARIETPPAVEKQEANKTFEQTLLKILELENDAQFNEAYKLCRKVVRTFNEPAQADLLGKVLDRLRNERTEATQLSFATKSLADGASATRSVSRSKLRAGGETGRILLRKVVREGTEIAVVEAGSLLTDMGDKSVPNIFIERLRTSPPGPVVAALISLLQSPEAALDYRLIMELCDLAAKQGPNRLTILNIILDALEQSVTPHPPSDKPKPEDKNAAKPVPELDRLPARIGNLEPQVVNTIITFIEQQAADRPKDAPPPTPEELAAVKRCEKILVESGFLCLPDILVQKLARDPAATVSAKLAGILKQLTGRLDMAILKQLADYAIRGGANEISSVNIMIDALEISVTPAPPADKPDQKMTPAWQHLPARLDMNQQSAIVNGLVAFVVRQAAPRPKDAPQPSAAEKTAVTRVTTVLVKGRLPQVPGFLVTRLAAAPAGPVSSALAGLMKPLTAQIDQDTVALLCEHVTKAGPNQTMAVSIMMDALEYFVTPAPPTDKPDQKMVPALDKLPIRLKLELQPIVAQALIAFLEKQTAPRAKDAPPATPEETATVARTEKFLVESRLPQVPGLLTAKLAANPKAPMARRAVKLLEPMTARLHELDANQQASLIDSLLKFVEDLVKPGPKNAPQPTPEAVAALGQAEKILVNSHLPMLPGLLFAKLTADPAGPVAQQTAKILKQLTPQQDPLALKQHTEYLVLGGANQVAAADLMMDLIEYLVSPAPPANEPTKKMPPVLGKLPTRLNREMQLAVSTALIAFVEKETAPRPKEATPAAPEDLAAVARAETLLVESRLPNVPGLLVGTLIKDPATPIAVKLTKLLKSMTGRLDTDNLKLLADYVIKAGPHQSAAADLLMDSLTSMVTLPPANKPAIQTLPARLNPELQETVAGALIAFVEKQATPRPKDTPPPTAEETASVARAESILVESGLPPVTVILLQKLLKQPDGPATERMVNLLKILNRKIDDQALSELAKLARKDTPNKALIADLVIHTLTTSAQGK